MKSSSTKLSITLPSDLCVRMRKIAKKEHRTLSGVLQECARYYLLLREWEEIQRNVSRRAVELRLHDEDAVDDLIHSI